MFHVKHAPNERIHMSDNENTATAEFRVQTIKMDVIVTEGLEPATVVELINNRLIETIYDGFYVGVAGGTPEVKIPGEIYVPGTLGKAVYVTRVELSAPETATA